MIALRSIAAATPGVVVAVLPKCPVCLGAYVALAGVSISPAKFLALTLALLALALLVLARAAGRTNRWRAFGLAAIGGVLVGLARGFAASTAWTWIGVALIYAGAVWIYTGRPRVRSTCC
jgi:hypothetical protein